MNDVIKVVGEISDDTVSISSAHLTQLSNLDPNLASVVCEALANVDFERRRQILEKLVDLAEEDLELNFDPIFRKSMEDEDEEVREKAINGLWECEERSLIEPLLYRLKHDEDERVRAAAAQLLGRFSMLTELGKLLERDAHRVEQGLLEMLESEDEDSFEVRRRTIEALAPINSEHVRSIILQSYENANEKVRASALYAMGQNGDSNWIPYVLEEMESEEPEIRYEAAGAAGRLGEESLIPALARMGNDDNPEVQSAVVTALGAIGGPTAERVLRRFLQHADDRMRELALDALEAVQTLKAPGTDILRRTPGAAGAMDEMNTEDDEDIFDEFDDDLGFDDDDEDDE
jgi:HEAT repeat protein